jgi:hypothetical protein
VPTDLPPRRQPAEGHPPTPGRFERWFGAVFFLAVLGILVAELVRDYSPLKLSVLFFVAARPITVALHEAGHALVARALGWRIHEVRIGLGEAWKSFHVGRVPVHVTIFPIGGFVRLAPRHLRQVRWRSAAIYLAGVGAELALLGLLVLAFGARHLLALHLDPATIAAQAVAASIVIDVVMNLAPVSYREPGGDPREPRLGSDGLGLVQSFTCPMADFERQLEP